VTENDTIALTMAQSTTIAATLDEVVNKAMQELWVALDGHKRAFSERWFRFEVGMHLYRIAQREMGKASPAGGEEPSEEDEPLPVEDDDDEGEDEPTHGGGNGVRER